MDENKSITVARDVQFLAEEPAIVTLIEDCGDEVDSPNKNNTGDQQNNQQKLE